MPQPSVVGGPANEGPAEATQVCEGDEYALSFSFIAQPTSYRLPGIESSIVQFEDDVAEQPSFGLQLWDDGSGDQRGFWASGDAMDGERFLAPVVEGVWHEAVIYFQASSEDDGFYLVFLDGEPVDARSGVSLIAPGSGCAQLEVGPVSENEGAIGAADVVFGPVRLGDTLESVIP